MTIEISSMTGPQQAAYAAAVGFAPTFSSASVALSASDIQNAGTTPIELVAAPGAGFLVIIHKCIVTLTYNSAPFLVQGYGVGYTDGSNPFVIGMTAFGGTADDLQVQSGDIQTLDPALAENQPLVFAGTGDDPLGNSTAIVTVYYSIFQL